MTITINVHNIRTVFSSTYTNVPNPFDVVTMQSGDTSVALFVKGGRGDDLAEAILNAAGYYDCADCGCYTPDPVSTDPHLCAECARARADEAAALREMADDDRAHAAADRRAGL